MNLNQNAAAMRQVLSSAKTIAVVGHSHKPHRDSYQIAQFLRQAGYIVYPVNPMLQQIDGQRCYASLQQLPQPIDIVNVFRRADYLPEIVEEAIAIHAKTVWSQLGIVHPEAAANALAAGLNIAMDVCIKVKYLRLMISRP